MSTENTFYRVRQTVCNMHGVAEHRWLQNATKDGWVVVPNFADSWRAEGKDGALAAARRWGGKVITVRHKFIPAKPRTHDRAWALRQLAKGRSVTHAEWAPGKRVCVTSKGLRELPGDFVCELVPPDGYTLWQEPAK